MEEGIKRVNPFLKKPQTDFGKELYEAVRKDLKREVERIRQSREESYDVFTVGSNVPVETLQIGYTVDDIAIGLHPESYQRLNDWLGSSGLKEVYGIPIIQKPEVRRDAAVVYGIPKYTDGENCKRVLDLIAKMFEEDGTLRPVEGDVVDMIRAYDKEVPKIQEGHINVAHLFEEESDDER